MTLATTATMLRIPAPKSLKNIDAGNYFAKYDSVVTRNFVTIDGLCCGNNHDCSFHLLRNTQCSDYPCQKD